MEGDKQYFEKCRKGLLVYDSVVKNKCLGPIMKEIGLSAVEAGELFEFTLYSICSVALNFNNDNFLEKRTEQLKYHGLDKFI
ncbi:MAG: hypothetical protein ABIF11_05420 [Nitrospirota bacterium]